MSDHFEQEISYWYDNSRSVDPEYIIFNENSPKPKTSYLVNNLACIYSRLNLFSKVALKIFKNIFEKQKDLEIKIQNCQEKLESCEELLRKHKVEPEKAFNQSQLKSSSPNYLQKEKC